MTYEEISAAIAYLATMQNPGDEGRAARTSLVRVLSELARKNAQAREIIEIALDKLERLPQKGRKAGAPQLERHIPRFRAYYLEGARRPTTKQLAARFGVFSTKITASLRIVCESLVPFICQFDTNKQEQPAGGHTSPIQPPETATNGE